MDCNQLSLTGEVFPFPEMAILAAFLKMVLLLPLAHLGKHPNGNGMEVCTLLCDICNRTGHRPGDGSHSKMWPAVVL